MSDHATQRRLAPAYALAFAVAIPRLQSIAREHGYALAVHGSMATDFDLIACPWTAEATDSTELVEALRAEVGGVLAERTWDTNPSVRPHGRLAWAIYPPGDGAVTHAGPYFDISVMPRLP